MNKKNFLKYTNLYKNIKYIYMRNKIHLIELGSTDKGTPRPAWMLVKIKWNESAAFKGKCSIFKFKFFFLQSKLKLV